MRHVVLSVLVLAVLAWAYVELSGGWYTYYVMPSTQCTALERGRLTLTREEPVPNQPNPCFVRYRRFQLP